MSLYDITHGLEVDRDYWRQRAHSAATARDAALSRVAELERENANLRKHIEDDRYCAAHGVEACIECEGCCESCGYDALEEDMVTTDDGERLCVDCAAVDAEDAESPDARGEEKAP